MNPWERLAIKFDVSVKVINNVRSHYFGGRNRLQTLQLFAAKIAKDSRKKSFRYPIREKTFLLLKDLTDEQYAEITAKSRYNNRFQGIRTILLEMVGKDIMIHSQPPTLEEFLQFHKQWRLDRIAAGKNKFHEEKRIKEYENSPDEVQEELKNTFNLITS